jgi:hypothetical protein
MIPPMMIPLTAKMININVSPMGILIVPEAVVCRSGRVNNTKGEEGKKKPAFSSEVMINLN